MSKPASHALVKRSQTSLTLGQAQSYYRIDRLAELSEQGVRASLQLHNQSLQIVVALLEELEQVRAKTLWRLTPQKERLIQSCVQNYLLEISHVMQRTNREMATIILQASSDLDDEAVVKKLYNFFKWYVRK